MKETMKKNILRAGVVVAAAAMLLGNIAPAQAAYQSNGSFGAVYLYDTNYSLSSSYGWVSEVVGSGSASSSTAVLTCPASATGAYTFLSTAANVATPGSWNASAPIALPASKNILQPNLSPSAQINGNALGVKTSGGAFALGVACTSNNGVTVIASYFRSITVTASTGAWVATEPAADTVGASLPTPTWSVTTNSSLAAAVGRAAGTVYVGDVLTAAKNQPTVFPADYTTTYQWNRNGTAIAGKTASTYTVVDADGYAKISVDVIYTAGGASVTKTSIETPMVLGGSAVLGGTVSLSAGVSAIANGFLELSIPTNAAASFGAPAVVNNYSVTTGTLGNVQVNDTRWITTDGWNLQADVATFVSGSNSIAKSNFGLVPSVVAASTTATGITAAAGTSAGSATYPAALASSAKSADLGDTGISVLNAALTLRAPRSTPAGTYTSTITLTLATK
jgi:hypothetical protein